MTEQHECEWEWHHGHERFQCSVCEDFMFPGSAEDMLNEHSKLKRATEALSAGIDEMMDAAKDDPNEMGGPFVSLSWVANTLEGKDG